MKKTSVKFLAMVFSVLMLVVLFAGCKSNGSSISSVAGSGSGQSPGKVFKVGLIQLLENTAFKDMREGFYDHLQANGFIEGENLEFIYENAQGDLSALNTICQKLVSQKVDLLVTIATPPTQVALQTMETQGINIPLLFISVSDPVSSGIVTDMKVPDKNATGTQNVIPIESNFELVEKLTPGVKTFGFLYTTGESNSLSTIENAKKYCDANGLNYVEATPTNSSEVSAAASSLVSKCDAIFVPNDSVIQSVMTQVAQIAIDSGVPLYGSSATMVEAGALATVSTADYEIGVSSAEMAIEILNGKTPAEIPVMVVEDVITVVNTDTAEKMDIEIPKEILESAVIITGMSQG